MAIIINPFTGRIKRTLVRELGISRLEGNTDWQDE
jgi:hypothetical protein